MSTFNGWNIVTLPAYPPPARIEWRLGDIVAASRSQFSLEQEQPTAFNASRMRASLTYPTMQNSQALQFLAFLASLQGKSNIFLWGDPQNIAPQNSGASGGTVSGANQIGYELVTTSSSMTPGDWIQLGMRLYRVQAVAGGTLTIWPNLRESPADGIAVVINNTQGLWRLAANKRKYSVKPGQIVEPITFEIEEAL